MRTHEFLNLYKLLEEALEERYGRQGRRYSSVVMEFIHSPEGEIWKEKMDVLREVRNIMTHTPDISGEAVITPAQGLVDTLREILAYVEKPPMALDYATRTQNILRASPEDMVLPLMRAMSRRGFSHVPVMRGERMMGVFSVSTVFSSVMQGSARVDDEARVRDFGDLLPVRNHMAEQFAFIGEQTTLPEAREAFERKEKRRMAALFITRGGEEDGKLLGMLTPWDVLRNP